MGIGEGKHLTKKWEEAWGCVHEMGIRGAEIGRLYGNNTCLLVDWCVSITRVQMISQSTIEIK